MALRSLVFKMKAAVPLPRGVVPRSATFFTAPKAKLDPKDEPWERIRAECMKASSMEEFNKISAAQYDKELKPLMDKLQRDIVVYRGLQLLAWVGAVCSIGYLKRRLG